MEFQPQIADRNQTLASKPLVGHSGLRRQRSRQVPIAFAAEHGQNRVTFTRTQGKKMANLPPFR